jgi:predicted HNH restriction endonuclease
MGGSKCKDHITNLTCLCRKCHDLCHKSKDFNKSVQAKTLRLIADKIEEQVEGNYEH